MSLSRARQQWFGEEASLCVQVYIDRGAIVHEDTA
jgi:hypothetical protein